MYFILFKLLGKARLNEKVLAIPPFPTTLLMFFLPAITITE